MNRKIYILALLAATSAAATAQTTKEKNDNADRVIVVEQEYNPDINDADKINVLPKTEKKSVPQTNVEYAKDEHKYNDRFQFSPANLIYKPVGPDKAKHTYIYAGYGNNGVADAGIYYNSPSFNNNEIHLDATFKGVDDNRELTPTLFTDGAEKWDARYYRTDINARYTHKFDAVKLYTGGNFGLDNFNYHPAFFNSYIDNKQRHTKGNINIGMELDGQENILFDLFLDYGYFSKAYNNEDWGLKNREHSAEVNTRIGYRYNYYSTIGLNVNMNSFNYTMRNMEDYVTLNLKPFYTFNRGDFNVRLGLNIDFAFTKENRFNTSPDVNIDYTFAKNYNVYANVNGGRIESGYRFLERINPYWNPNFMYKQTMAGDEDKIELHKNYKVLASNIGVKGSPVEGLRFDIKGGFDMNNGDICLMPNETNIMYSQYSRMAQQKTTLVYGEASVSYAFKDWVNFNLNGKIMDWGKAEDKYLGMKPKYQLQTSVDAKIIKDMFLNISYLHISRTDKSIAGNINDLSARLSYSFLKGLGVYINATNIISAKNYYYFAYPSPKASVVLGLSYNF